MTVFVSLLLPAFCILVDNPILYIKRQSSQMWRLSSEVESTTRLQAVVYFTLALGYAVFSLFKTLL
jgi:hypothetical protein